jgi:predicted PurR-regulated permease PerM
MNFKRLQTVAFFSLLLVVGVVFLWMIFPYVYALFWAAVIATIFHPVYAWLRTRLKNDNLAAFSSVILVLLVVIVPLAGVLGIVVQQAVGLYEAVRQPETLTNLQGQLTAILNAPIVQRFAGDVEILDRLRAASSTISSAAIRWIQAGAGSTIQVVVNLLVMIYALYYFFKDGDRWLKKAMHLLPFGDDNEKLLFQKFTSTAKATLKGTVLLGGLQGLLGGILFFIAGIPAAAFWGLIMIVLAIIPAVGAFLVWIPGAIYLFATGQIWQGVVVTVGGMLIGVLDNLLRPPLVGRDIQMHPILILFSTIGGIGLFGISGVVVGPIIAAFFLAVLEMYETRYRKELESSKS